MKAHYKPEKPSKLNFGMSLYQMNQQIIFDQGPIPEGRIAEKLDIINNFVSSTHKKYYMMLNHDIKYFTLFAQKSGVEDTLYSGVKDCISSIGELYEINYTEDGSAIEIWILPFKADLPIVFYLFDYESGVIEIA